MSIQTVGIIGAGTIGTAIAGHLVARHHSVHLIGHGQIELLDLDLIAQTFAQFPVVDVLINAAGTYGVPGKVGDGAAKTLNGQATFVGKAANETDIRRFLVGPMDCEITGVDMTPDGKTMFVNIPHPGDGGSIAAPAPVWCQIRAASVCGGSSAPA
jgi:nucleoside-diphosphate-sugar epimerase